jgi:hypothetical protein
LFNLDKDKAAIEKIGAETVFLPKSNRQQLEEQFFRVGNPFIYLSEKREKNCNL